MLIGLAFVVFNSEKEKHSFLKFKKKGNNKNAENDEE